MKDHEESPLQAAQHFASTLKLGPARNGEVVSLSELAKLNKPATPAGVQRDALGYVYKSGYEVK